MSRIDYSKWDKLDYSSSSSEDGKSEETAMREKAIRAMEMLLLRETSSSPLWNGLVKHHKDIFVSHVLPKLNKTDRWFFAKVNSEGKNLLKYAGINVLEMGCSLYDCSSISTLEWAWNVMRWGAKAQDGTVMDQAFFCCNVAATKKLELLKWAREVKHCEWDERTIDALAARGQLEMLKYCFSNGCPCDEENSSAQAACGGHLECLRFLFDKMKPPNYWGDLPVIDLSAIVASVDIQQCAGRRVSSAARYGRLDCVKYLMEEEKPPLDDWRYVATARFFEQHECLDYLREKGSREPSDEEYALYAKTFRERKTSQQ
jgi:hypothetical protein